MSWLHGEKGKPCRFEKNIICQEYWCEECKIYYNHRENILKAPLGK